MSAVRLHVYRTRKRNPEQWVARLEVPLPTGEARPATVGMFPTWDQALSEGCVAGRLQAAGISWGSPAPEVPEMWDTATGTGEGEALSPVPEDAYPPGAIPLEELPVDAVGRSLPSMTFGQWRDEEREGWDYP